MRERVRVRVRVALSFGLLRALEAEQPLTPLYLPYISPISRHSKQSSRLSTSGMREYSAGGKGHSGGVESKYCW